jgi:hypothetical protein
MTNNEMLMDWNKLQDVHDKSLEASVSYSLHHAGSDDSWYFVISSNSPSECWIGINSSFDIAVEHVIRWLNLVLAGPEAIKAAKAECLKQCEGFGIGYRSTFAASDYNIKLQD